MIGARRITETVLPMHSIKVRLLAAIGALFLALLLVAAAG